MSFHRSKITDSYDEHDAVIDQASGAVNTFQSDTMESNFSIPHQRPQVGKLDVSKRQLSPCISLLPQEEAVQSKASSDKRIWQNSAKDTGSVLLQEQSQSFLRQITSYGNEHYVKSPSAKHQELLETNPAYLPATYRSSTLFPGLPRTLRVQGVFLNKKPEMHNSFVDMTGLVERARDLGRRLSYSFRRGLTLKSSETTVPAQQIHAAVKHYDIKGYDFDLSNTSFDKFQVQDRNTIIRHSSWNTKGSVASTSIDNTVNYGNLQVTCHCGSDRRFHQLCENSELSATSRINSTNTESQNLDDGGSLSPFRQPTDLHGVEARRVYSALIKSLSRKIQNDTLSDNNWAIEPAHAYEHSQQFEIPNLIPGQLDSRGNMIVSENTSVPTSHRLPYGNILNEDNYKAATDSQRLWRNKDTENRHVRENANQKTSTVRSNESSPNFGKDMSFLQPSSNLGCDDSARKSIYNAVETQFGSINPNHQLLKEDPFSNTIVSTITEESLGADFTTLFL